MNPRVVVPILVIAIAAYFGWQQHQSCAIVLPGVPVPSQCQTPVPQPTPPVTPPPVAVTPPPPQPTPPVAPPPSSPTPPATPVTPPSPPPATSGYPEASLDKPDVNVAVNLRPERAEILEAYNSKNFAEALGKANTWLNSRPTDALMGLVKNNALQKQLGVQTVTLGLSLPTSGRNVQTGEAILQGVNMAVQEANAADGIKGRKIIVDVLNDQNDPTLSVTAASSFIGAKEVLAVIGPQNSSSAVAASSIYNGGQLVHISPVATDDKLASAGVYTYRMFPPSSTQGKALVKLIQRDGRVRVPLYYNPDDAFSKSLADAFQNAATATGSISVVPFTYAKNGLPDGAGFDVFSDSPAPDAAFISGDYNDVSRIAKALEERGHKVPLYGGSAAYGQEILRAGSSVEGMTMVSVFHNTANFGDIPSFVKAFQKRYGGGTPNARAMQAYDTTRVLLEALRRTSSLSREGVRTALQSFTAAKPGPGVTSKVQFNNGGIVGRPLVVIKVENGKLEASGTVQ
jgi:branched-chain amino acid transport system substrate-binding protein